MKAALCSPYKYLQAVLISVQEVGSMIYNILQSVRCWSTWLRGIFLIAFWQLMNTWNQCESKLKLYLVVWLPSYGVFPLSRVHTSPTPRPSALGILIWGVRVYFAYTLNILNIVSAWGIHFVINSREVSRQVLSFLEMKTLARVEYHDICKLLNQVCHVMISNE